MYIGAGRNLKEHHSVGSKLGKKVFGMFRKDNEPTEKSANDSFVRVFLDDHKLLDSRTIENSNDPGWYQNFNIP
ncbi:hypothetical protein SARC_17425, partial [Sphaeroforma arctica JP610]